MVKRLMSLVLVLALGLGALAGGLVASRGVDGTLALISGGDTSEDHAATEAGDDGHAPAADGHGAPAEPGRNVVVTPFKEIIVNITATTATGRQTTRFLKLNTALVYDSSQPGAAQIEERKLYLRDSFQDYLRQLSERDVQGSAGIAILKAELLRRARTISDSAAPQEILISDLIVQ